MVKRAMLVLFELATGVTAAALLLAVTVPLLIGYHILSPGDLASSVVIGAALLGAIGVALFRPNSAFRRFGKRDR